jgi:hypothetical protein
MGNYDVSNSQLAVYFVFTILSLIISLVVYCLYFHGFSWARPDYLQHVQHLTKMVEKKASNEDTVKEALIS